MNVQCGSCGYKKCYFAFVCSSCVVAMYFQDILFFLLVLYYDHTSGMFEMMIV